MSGYIKLFQACCNYGYDGSYAPKWWKIDWRSVDLGPGYEQAEVIHRVPYNNGPLGNAGFMRCQWESSEYGGILGFLLSRWAANVEQSLFHGDGRFDWPGKAAWVTYDLIGSDWGFGPADATWTLERVAFDSLDGLFTPPTELEFAPWRVDDVLPPGQ